MINIIEHVNYLFDRIVTYSEITPENRKKMTIFKGENFKTEFEKLNNLKNFTFEPVLHNIKIYSYFNDENRFIALTGFDSIIEHNDKLLEPIEFGIEHFIFLSKLTNLSINTNNTKSDVINNLLYQQNDEGYQGHDHEDLISYFDKVYLYKVDPNNILYSAPTLDISYCLISQIDDIITLPLGEMRYDYSNILTSEYKIPKENVFLSMTAVHWKHSFLELYRCLEWLYVLPRVLELKNAIEYTKTGSELAKECMDKLSWRKKEEDSLQKLLSSAFYHDIYFKEESTCLGIFSDIKPAPEAIAKYVYRLRNQFVHQFNPEDEVHLSDDNWKDLIYFTLKLTHTLYDKYNAELC